MANVDARLKKYFDEYDKAGAVPASLDNKKIEQILAGKSDQEMPKKINALCNLILSVESAINAKLSDSVSNISAVEIAKNFTISSNPYEPEYSTKISMSKAGAKNQSVANIALDINIQKIFKLPAERVYSVIYALVEGSILNKALDKNTLSAEDEEYKSVELVRDVEEAEKLSGKKSKANRSMLANLIKYIANGLKELFGEKYSADKINAISKNIADNYANAYGGIENAYGEMFDASKLKSDPSIEDLNLARISKILQNAEKQRAEANPVGEMSYAQQASALLSEKTKVAFERMKTGEAGQLQEFCVKFIGNFVTSNGYDVSSVEVEFINNPNGPQGRFVDGNQKKIQVNLAKVKNTTDLVMTMTHEGTHAIDALNNEYSQKAGGLIDACRSKKPETLGLDPLSKEGKLLRYLNNAAYHLDPNERRGRIGELAGLKFMTNFADDAATKTEIAKNITSFNNYQQRTIQIATDLQSLDSKYSLTNLKNSFFDVYSSLTETQRDAITQQLDYLERVLNNGIDLTAERQSVLNSRDVRSELSGVEFVGESFQM